MGKTKMGNIIFNGSLSSEEALAMFLWKITSKWRPIAFLLQRFIANTQKDPLPEHLTQTDILLQGEVELLENLCKLLHYLIYGPNKMQTEDHRKRKQQRT